MNSNGRFEEEIFDESRSPLVSRTFRDTWKTRSIKKKKKYKNKERKFPSVSFEYSPSEFGSAVRSGYLPPWKCVFRGGEEFAAEIFPGRSQERIVRFFAREWRKNRNHSRGNVDLKTFSVSSNSYGMESICSTEYSNYERRVVTLRVNRRVNYVR